MAGTRGPRAAGCSDRTPTAVRNTTVPIAKMCAIVDLSGASVSVFFFQAEDGIRDLIVTGVQTCALPILWRCDFELHPCAHVQARGGHHPVCDAPVRFLAAAPVKNVR